MILAALFADRKAYEIVEGAPRKRLFRRRRLAIGRAATAYAAERRLRFGVDGLRDATRPRGATIGRAARSTPVRGAFAPQSIGLMRSARTAPAPGGARTRTEVKSANRSAAVRVTQHLESNA